MKKSTVDGFTRITRAKAHKLHMSVGTDIYMGRSDKSDAGGYWKPQIIGKWAGFSEQVERYDRIACKGRHVRPVFYAKNGTF